MYDAAKGEKGNSLAGTLGPPAVAIVRRAARPVPVVAAAARASAPAVPIVVVVARGSARRTSLLRLHLIRCYILKYKSYNK